MNTATTIRTVAHMEGHSGPSLTCTTMDPDRDGDRIMPQGGQLVNFLKNPVLLFGHQAKDIPIGKVTSLQISETGIRAHWTWLENDLLADRVKNAWDQGVLNSASIGFLPKQMKPNAHGGYDILAWELLEISLVALPANPMATRALKSLGLLEPDTAGPAMLNRSEALASMCAELEFDDEPMLLELDMDDDLEVEPAVLHQAVAHAVGVALRQVIDEALHEELNYHLGRID